MRGKIRRRIYAPDSLVKHIERELKEIKKENPTKIDAMEKIAKELDELVIKRRRKLRI